MTRFGLLGRVAAPLVLVGALFLPGGIAPPRAVAATPCPAGPVTLQDLIRLAADRSPILERHSGLMAPMLMSDLALECYGDRTLRFTAWVRDPGVVGWEHPVGLKPAWFRGADGLFVSVAAEFPPGVTPLVALAVPPALGDLQAQHVGHWVTVTGHFDDPAAASCTATGEAGVAPSPAEAVTICRSTFVVAGVSRTAAPSTSTTDAAAPAPQIEPWRVGAWLVLSGALGGLLAVWLGRRFRRATSASAPH